MIVSACKFGSTSLSDIIFFPFRIVIVSSVGHMYTGTDGIKFNDLNYESANYTYMKAYDRSKLANILHAKELADRLDNTNISVYSLHPGLIITDLSNDVMNCGCFAMIFKKIAEFSLKTTFHGAQTILYCCLEDKIEGESGKYYVGCKEAIPSPQAQDKNSAKKLWELSEKLVGLNIHSE